MVINKTTREERLVVENAMWSIIAEIDTANQILMDLWERYFGMARQHKHISLLDDTPAVFDFSKVSFSDSNEYMEIEDGDDDLPF